ncbi:MAG TPA: hypothetical protein VMW27_12040 [Thermoanaerobaculia bacterium]|nr:hypothetical protein [Thermoanaerobaculia bacterium]
MIGQLIPQVVYDIIGRLVPGLALLGVCRFLWPQDFLRIWGEADPSSTPGTVAFLIAAYILALLLEGLSALTLDHVIRPFQQKAEQNAGKHALMDFSRLEEGFEPGEARLPGIPIIYDAVRLKNPGVGSNIVKLRAEAHLYRTLMMGVLLLFLGVVLDAALRGAVRAPLLTCILLAAVFAVVFVQCIARQKRLAWALYNHYLLLVKPGFQGLAAEPSDEK